MTNQSKPESNLPDWTQNTSADEMVKLVKQLLEAEGRTTTKRGRARLRVAYEIHIRSFDRPDTEIAQAGVLSEESAARKLIELAKESGVFAGFTRAGYVVMDMMVKVAEQRAKRDKVCPAWPFC